MSRINQLEIRCEILVALCHDNGAVILDHLHTFTERCAHWGVPVTEMTTVMWLARVNWWEVRCGSLVELMLRQNVLMPSNFVTVGDIP